MIEEFIAWEEKIRPEITHVSEILSQQLSDEPSKLIEDLENIEAWNGRIGALMAQSDSWLDRYSLICMPPREGKTEADRRAEVESIVSPIRLVRDTLEHFVDCIKQRLILGESILSYSKQFVEHKKVANLDHY